MKRLIVNKVGIVVILLLASLFLLTCRSSDSVASSNGTTSASVPMRQVTDDLGRTILIPTKITRVVSLAPNLTENIFAVGAGDRLVGVTTFCNYPEQAKEIAKIGDTMTPNMETIVALKPDVVFVSTASQIEAFMKTLEQNGIAVYVTNPMSVEEVFAGLHKLDSIFMNEDIVSVESLRGRVSNIQERVASERPAKVFVQISKEPLFTIGKAAFVNDLLRIAGGESVTANVESAYPKLSKETASALNPEAIILSDSEDNREPNDAFKSSPAVKNGRVYKVNADILSRPGPRLVDALEQIARQLHPEKFRNK